MSSVADVQAALLRASGMYSDLTAEYLSDLKKGCGDCLPKNYKCLKRLRRALEFEVTKGIITPTAESLYTQLLLVLGTYQASAPPVTQYNLLFGYTNLQPTDANILDFALQFTKQVAIGALEITLNFTTASINNYLIARVPVGEPRWITWFNDVFSNSGNIPDEKWTSVTVGDYKYYYTRVPLSLDALNPTIKFTGVPSAKIANFDTTSPYTSYFQVSIDGNAPVALTPSFEYETEYKIVSNALGKGIVRLVLKKGSTQYYGLPDFSGIPVNATTNTGLYNNPDQFTVDIDSNVVPNYANYSFTYDGTYNGDPAKSSVGVTFQPGETFVGLIPETAGFVSDQYLVLQTYLFVGIALSGPFSGNVTINGVVYPFSGTNNTQIIVPFNPSTLVYTINQITIN